MNVAAWVVAIAAVVVPWNGVAVAEVQRGVPVPRIGVLSASSPQSPLSDALRQGLREVGYVEGQSIGIEWRTAIANTERFPKLAAELVRLNVAIIVASNSPAVDAARKATKTIPIVMVMVPDPVRLGFVASLARPGGNITGLTMEGPTLGKRVELLREVVPALSRVAVLWDSSDRTSRDSAGDANRARAVGVHVQNLEVRSLTDLQSAFAATSQEMAGAVGVRGSGFFFTHRTRIAELATERRLPSICATRDYVEAGCLMSYSTDVTDLHRRAAGYVDKILKGAKPADLPVEQPTKFELVINLKTAKALGLTLPPLLLLRADQVIE
jgi:putative ABC transport system substrate-binding protein